MTTVPARPGAVPQEEGGSAHAGAALLLASGATFLALLDATVVNVAFPDLHSSFPDVSVSRLSWVITAYAVVFAGLLAAAGRLADVVGRRRLFLISVLGFTATSLAAGAAPSAAWLIAARAVQGATAAGMIPAALGLLLAHTPPARRAAALGAWGAAGGIAAAVGPSLGGLLVDSWNWRGIFLINVPLGLLIGYGTSRLTADKPSGKRLPDLLGMVAMVLAIGGPVTALSQGADWGWTSPEVLLLFAAGVVFGAVVALRSRRHPAPAFETDLWRSPVFTAANVTSALFGAAMYAWLLACPLFLASIWHYSVLKSGLGVTPGAFLAAVGAVIVGRRMPVEQQWKAVVFGGVLAGASFAVMGLTLDSSPSYAALWLPPGLLGGLGIGCVLTGLSSIASAALPADRFAAGSGMLMTSRQVGGAVGVAGLAVILESEGLGSPDGFLTGFLWCGVTAVLAGVSAVAMRRRD
ncbi:DHA2 family efflux MFS transporter permease subunit [Streptomyces sp. NPDC006923]|uniref:DHA2 family efflux MFS transporter permease subunit n=1 Tax=Streptomyces sp. NPDC006923 TaxID=3155355 RepID=UPI0033D22784